MNTQIDDPRLTAYALGELEGDEKREIESLVASSTEAREAIEDIRRTATRLEQELAQEPAAKLDDVSRQQIEARVLAGRIRRWGGYAIAASIVLLLGGFSTSVMLPSLHRARKYSQVVRPTGL